MHKKRKLLNSSDTIVSLQGSDHDNQMLFTATIMTLDEFSTAPPHGSNGNLVLLPTEEALQSADSMTLMGINCVWDNVCCPSELLSGHDGRSIVGVVKRAYVEDGKLKIDGIIYKDNFPDLADFIKNTVESIGFSIEAYCNYEEIEGGYKMKDVEFTGVAMLFKEEAAYKKTEIEKLVAKGEEMTKEEILQIANEVADNVVANKIAEFKASEEKRLEVKKAEEETAKIKSANEDLKKQVEDLKKENEDLKKQLEDAKAEKSKADEDTKCDDENVDAKKADEAKASKVEEGVVLSDLATKSKFEANAEKKDIKAMTFADIISARMK